MNNQVWRSPKCKTPRKNTIRKLASPLVIAGLMAAGQFQLIPQAIAVGTAAGTTINNTATATFNDPSGNSLTTISNEVTVTVAETAGLTNVAQTPIDPNGGSVIPGDTVQIPFLITNTGNNPTDIYIPDVTNITVNNLNSPGVYLDLDNDGIPDYFLPSGGGTGAQEVIVNGDDSFSPGADTTDPNPPTYQTNGWVVPGIVADDSITVIVQGTVPTDADPGDQITVVLGSTGSNNSDDADSQNRPDDGTSADASDGGTDTLAAVDEVRTTSEAGGANGNREAADTSDPLTVGQGADQPLALVTAEKEVDSVDPGATGAISDDIITYTGGFVVGDELPFGYTGNYAPAALTGTPLKIDSSTAGGSYILVSDAKPQNAAFVDPNTTPPTGPNANWTVVYTTDALTIAPTDAEWSTTIPATPANITRIGFIYNTSNLSPIAPGTSVGPFTLFATGATASPVRNLIQVFGTSAGDPNDNIVFDESGDQNPNNFLGDTPKDGDPYGEYDPANDPEDLGDPANEDGSDPNDGTPNDGGGNDTPDGEPNELVLTPTTGALVNGPFNVPVAIGPTNFNDDFVEKSITEPVTTGGSIADPNAVVFDNSVKNDSTVLLENVVLRPIDPAAAATVCAACDTAGSYDSIDEAGSTIEIPAGTTVTITLPVQPGVATQQTATYSWNATNDAFDLTSPSQVSIPALAAGQELDYKVSVDLPSGSVVDAFDVFSIPVVAYVNNDTNTTFEPASETIRNLKVDRLYAGYLKLTKTVEVFYADGGSDGPSSVGTDIDPQPGPGDTLEYVVTYENIATTAPVSPAIGNVLLPANNVVIRENGLGLDPNAGDNNWALDNDGNSIIDTSNVVGTAAGTGTILYFSGNPASTAAADQTGTTAVGDVTEYRNNVGVVAPGATGTFTFQRKIN
ncbi:hypothetical protein [Picosynechococcus sp. NKBG042902]|uniref:beta strand repeat-containing protein n=1 Tax=Picosynechococcus sp. NKBG042902 TaxID=490193 RepID=UPI00126955C1|nr:hypothetical protein [Picosynechococcus sp. NKBG042902]